MDYQFDYVDKSVLSTQSPHGCVIDFLDTLCIGSSADICVKQHRLCWFFCTVREIEKATSTKYNITEYAHHLKVHRTR